MGLDLVSLRRQLRESIGLEGDDTTNLPDLDSPSKTGADTYLNRSYWELLDKFKFREKEVTATFSTVAGTKFYQVPSLFEALQGIAIEDPDTLQHTPLDRMSPDEYEQEFMDTTGDQGKPTGYFREGNGIRLWRTPDKVYELTLHYWTVLSDLSSTNTTSPLPQNWHEVLLFGATWRAMIGVNADYAGAQAAKANQISLIEGTSQVEEKEQFDSHRAGVEVPGYDELNL